MKKTDVINADFSMVNFARIIFVIYFVVLGRNCFGVDNNDFDQEGREASSSQLTLINKDVEKFRNLMDPKILAENAKKYDTPQNQLKIQLPCVLLVGFSVLKAAYDHFEPSPLFVTKIVGSAVIGIEGGDLLSGIEHAVLDHIPYKNKNYPYFLRESAYVFQAHHYNTQQVTKASYWLLTRHTHRIPLLALATIAAYNGYSGYAAIASLSLLSLAQAQFIHACTHGKKVAYPRLQQTIEWLQSHYLLLNSSHHASHHQGPEHGRGFCGVTGHMDIILDPIVKGIKYLYGLRKARWPLRPASP